MKKIFIAAMLLAMGAAMPAHAGFNQAVSSFTIVDVVSGGTGLNQFASGAFKFGVINDATYSGTSLFTSDLGPVYTASAQAAGSFTTGFIFAFQPFVPKTTGPINATISYTAGSSTPVLTFPSPVATSLPWAGDFGTAPAITTFFLPPADANDTLECGAAWLPLTVYWLNRIDATHFEYKIGWSHCIKSAEVTPAGQVYVGFNANWRLEGVATVAADSSAPTVYLSTPSAANTVSNPVPTALTNVVVTFDEPMNPSSLTTSSITVSGGLTFDTVTPSANNTVFSFHISSGALAIGSYTLTFNAGPTDIAGNALTLPGVVNFFAGVDSTPPQVLSTLPATGATNVATGTSQIVVTFNEGMDPASVTASSISVSGGVMVGGPAASAGDAVFTFPITSGTLTEGTTYTITFNAGPTDISNNALAVTAPVSFTTVAATSTTTTQEAHETPPGSLGGGGCAMNPNGKPDLGLLSLLTMALVALGWRRVSAR